MSTFDSKRVSSAWKTVLTAARADGVSFRLNSGWRSMAEQRALYNRNMSGGRPRPGRPLTAVPSRTAPHIRPDHDIDINSLDGGEARLQRWLERKGVDVTNPVPGEAWHMHVPFPQLKALAARVGSGAREASYRRRLAAAYKSRRRQTHRSRVGFFNRRVQAIKRRLKNL